MKLLTLVFFWFSLLLTPFSSINTKTIEYGKCTGSAPCSACKSCSACKYCNAGGSCGVCAKVSLTKVSKYKKNIPKKRIKKKSREK